MAIQNIITVRFRPKQIDWLSPLVLDPVKSSPKKKNRQLRLHIFSTPKPLHAEARGPGRFSTPNPNSKVWVTFTLTNFHDPLSSLQLALASSCLDVDREGICFVCFALCLSGDFDVSDTPKSHQKSIESPTHVYPTSIQHLSNIFFPVSYTHLTLPTSDLV